MVEEAVSKIIEKISKNKEPLQEHLLVYESSSESLEPIYFFIVDLMNTMKLGPEKLIDNFVSSPGSGHFAELGQRATIMQQQGVKVMGDINTIVRSVLNLVYDLKEFRIRLKHYDELKSKDENRKDAAKYSLKQIWLDKVDITKGNSSIKAMALGQAGFQTLLDAFLIAKDAKHASTIDLNDRIKRIVMARIEEFNLWVQESERELKKRYEMERSYLRSQVNSLKIYSRWAKPYLKAATQLEQMESGRNPDLIKTFNTILLQLTLLGKSEIKLDDLKKEGMISPDYKVKKPLKKYYACVLINLYFRGIPQKISQRGDYSFGGRTEVTFKSYVLNEEELKLMDKELNKSDVEDAFKLIQGATDESLQQLQDDINSFLDEKEDSSEKEDKKNRGENPFLALFGFYNKSEKKEEKKSKKEGEVKLTPESWVEKNYLRKLAEEVSKKTTFDLFDIYKKSHGMASFP